MKKIQTNNLHKFNQAHPLLMFSNLACSELIYQALETFLAEFLGMKKG